MSHSLANNVDCFLGLIDEKPCAFISVIYFPHPKAKNIYKTHRLVVLPEYQGLSIGRIMTDEIAKMYLKSGYRFRETTSHPARIASHKKNKNWICCHQGRVGDPGTTGNGVGGNSRNRFTTSWEFIGK